MPAATEASPHKPCYRGQGCRGSWRGGRRGRRERLRNHGLQPKGEGMRNLMSKLAGLNDLANLLLRLMLGAILIRAGAFKFFEAGLSKITDNFRGYGIIPLPEVAAPLIAALELGGGVLLVLGLFTRYIGVLYTLEFIVAAWVKYAIIPPPNGGYLIARLDMLIIVVAFLLATQGAGKFSLDAKFRPGDV